MGIRFVSLFSGAMGLDLGLEQAGFETGVCVENDPDAVGTIKRNRPDLAVIDRSVEEVSGKDLRAAARYAEGEEVPLVAGGPPCQAFSVFGNRLGIRDGRGRLIFEFIRIVDELRPSVFVLENVRGLLSMSVVPKSGGGNQEGATDSRMYEHGSLLRMIFEDFNRIGYHVDCFVVNAVNYGAPQIRERLLMIGNRGGQRASFPQPTHSNRRSDGLLPFRTLGDAIGPGSGFSDPQPEVMDFSPRKLRYLSMVPAGGNWRSLPVDVQKESMGRSWYLKGGRSAYWRKLSYAFPCPTVVTMPNHAGTSMCHPTELRAISVKEAAYVQEFPEYWQFTGSASAKFRQIGNAVPVRLGRIAGGVARDLLDQIRKDGASLADQPSSRVMHMRPHVRTRSFWKNGRCLAGDYSYYDTSVRNSETEQVMLPGFSH